MQSYKIKNSTLKGEIAIPPSKSHTLRALLFSAMARGKSTIHHYLPSPDTQAMIAACRNFGASVGISENSLNVGGLNGVIAHAEDVIQAGNSGIVLRFCSAIGALSTKTVVVTGDHSIRHYRPMKSLLEGLSQLGVHAYSMRDDGYAPVIVQGPINPGKTIVDGEDSQPVSALLIASSFASGPVEIAVRNPGEKPWVALTLHWFDRLGIPYQNDNFDLFRLNANASYEGFEYTVPGDFSSAAFPLAAALVTQSELILKNLDIHDIQGDKELINIFQKMGAEIEIDETAKELRVKKAKELHGLDVDINLFIDAITVLAVVACFAEGETRLFNGAIARHKECNRINCIAVELKKMGADIEETEDGLIIRKSKLRGAILHSYHDHRMAMALAVAAMGAEGESVITSIECISKTYPSFVQDLNSIGAEITRI